MDSKMIPKRAQAKEKEIIEKIDKIKSRGTISPITNNTEYNTDDYNKLKVLQAELRGFRKGYKEALSTADKKCEKRIELFENRMYSEERKLLEQISDLEKSFSMLEEQHNEQKETIDKLKAEKEEMLEKIIILLKGYRCGGHWKLLIFLEKLKPKKETDSK